MACAQACLHLNQPGMAMLHGRCTYAAPIVLTARLLARQKSRGVFTQWWAAEEGQHWAGAGVQALAALHGRAHLGSGRHCSYRHPHSPQKA